MLLVVAGFQASISGRFWVSPEDFTINVPEGKRLTIESASARVSLPPGQRARAFVSGNFTTGVGMQHLTLEFQGTFAGADVYTTTQPVRLFIQGPSGNPGSGTFSVLREGTGNVFAEVSIAGFLEDAP